MGFADDESMNAFIVPSIAFALALGSCVASDSVSEKGTNSDRMDHNSVSVHVLGTPLAGSDCSSYAQMSSASLIFGEMEGNLGDLVAIDKGDPWRIPCDTSDDGDVTCNVASQDETWILNPMSNGLFSGTRHSESESCTDVQSVTMVPASQSDFRPRDGKVLADFGPAIALGDGQCPTTEIANREFFVEGVAGSNEFYLTGEHSDDYECSLENGRASCVSFLNRTEIEIVFVDAENAVGYSQTLLAPGCGSYQHFSIHSVE